MAARACGAFKRDVDAVGERQPQRKTTLLPVPTAVLSAAHDTEAMAGGDGLLVLSRLPYQDPSRGGAALSLFRQASASQFLWPKAAAQTQPKTINNMPGLVNPAI